MFRPGERYQVKKEIESASSRFVLGEVLIFSEASYSRYDSSSAFMFRTESSGETKAWFLHDDEVDRSNELFERVD